MPNVYRAPEVILKSNWGYEVDIWSVAMVAWDIVSPRTLINVYLTTGFIWQTELVALLGPPPPKFREQGHLCSVSWDELGNWKDLGPIPDISLESLTEKVEGENKGCLSHGCIY